MGVLTVKGWVIRNQVGGEAVDMKKVDLGMKERI